MFSSFNGVWLCFLFHVLHCGKIKPVFSMSNLKRWIRFTYSSFVLSYVPCICVSLWTVWCWVIVVLNTLYTVLNNNWTLLFTRGGKYSTQTKSQHPHLTHTYIHTYVQHAYTLLNLILITTRVPATLPLNTGTSWRALPNRLEAPRRGDTSWFPSQLLPGVNLDHSCVSGYVSTLSFML